MPKSQSAEPKALSDGIRQFARWRQTRQNRKIPDHLWKLAASLAKRFGACKTARLLSLDYNGLKSRLSPPKAIDHAKNNFVEVQPVLQIPCCSLEIDYRDGTQVHLQLNQPTPQQLEALACFVRGKKA